MRSPAGPFEIVAIIFVSTSTENLVRKKEYFEKIKKNMVSVRTVLLKILILKIKISELKPVFTLKRILFRILVYKQCDVDSEYAGA